MTLISVKPLSVNKCYRGRRFKTEVYKAYEEYLLYKLPLKHIREAPYQLNIKVGLSSSLADLDNTIKCFQDILQKKYGFNDKDIFKIIAEKKIVKKGGEFIDFDIIPYEL